MGDSGTTTNREINMSEAPQGPGWWLASDGKYYPPQGAAAPAPPPAPIAPPVPAPPYAMPGQPQMGQPQMGMPIQPMAPVKKSGGKGCLWAFLIVAFLTIVVVVGGIFFIGKKVGDEVGGFSCSYLSEADAKEVFGAPVTIFQTGNLTAGADFTLDDRILPGEKACNITRNGTATAPQIISARVVKLDKPDAAAFYQAELAKAKAGGGTVTIPTITIPDISIPDITMPDGSPIVVPTVPTVPTVTIPGGGYFLKDVTLGDEAFCTRANFFDGSGVLVRKGNTIVHAAVTAGTSTGADRDFSESNCEYAMKLATKALG